MDRKTPLDIYEEQIRTHARSTTLGEVVRVFEHTDPDDNSNHEVSVILRDQGKQLRRIPIIAGGRREAVVPQIGTLVAVSFLTGASEAPVVTQVLQDENKRAPLARAGHWRREFEQDDGSALYIEAEPSDHAAGDPDVIRLAKKPDGLSDPTTSVEIDDSGATTTIRLETDGRLEIVGAGDIDIDVGGTVNLSAGGDIVIDQGGTAKRLATEDHTHDVSGSTSDGASFSTTTGEPSDVTEAKVE